jgi:phage terminase large subunit
MPYKADTRPKLDLTSQYRPHARQILAHTAKERFVNYGGAFGGGKTIWLVNESIQLSLDYPGNVGYLCRNELPAFRRSVLIELEKFIHPQILEQHHQTENYYKFKNGSYIYYGGLGDDKAGLARLSSMTLGWFAIDQAEETTETHFNMLAGRLRLILPGIRYKGLLTCNPAPGWVKQKFVEQKLDNHIFIQSLPKDNPYLPPDYESELRKIYPPEWIKAMLEGDWSALEGGNFLFRYAELRRAVDKEIAMADDTPKWMGVDIAREGDDSSVATVRQGQKVIHIEEWAKTDLMQTSGKVLSLMERFNLDAKNVNLDSVGVGAGVYDRLKEQKIHINGIIAGGEPMDKEHYINSRAEMYDNLRKRFEDSSISIPNDQDLIAQCSSIRFKFASDKKLQIISKEEMKRQYRLKSPDKADSLALCYYEPLQHNPNLRWL